MHQKVEIPIQEKIEVLSDLKGSKSVKKEGGELKIEANPLPSPKKKKAPETYDISPKIFRQFRIYNISSSQPVQQPYSKDTEWQQILQLYVQKLNMPSVNLGSLKNKKQIEIESHLEQVQMHRDIELMVKILNLRNRNWVQEQIRMSRRL